MLSIPKAIDFFERSTQCFAEDFIDQLNFRACFILLGFFSLMTGTKQHFGNPIQCLTPAESTDSWVNYYHDYCFIQDKIRLKNWNFNHNIIKELNTNTKGNTYGIRQDADWGSTVVYYQWVPYLLFVQSLCFLFPKLVWKSLGSFFGQGPDVDSALLEAGRLKSLSGESRKEGLEALASFILEILNWKRRKSYLGDCSLSLCYVACKMALVLNSVGQFYLLTMFVGSGDHLWGFTIISSILNEKVVDPTEGIFPRIVKCSVQQSEMGNPARTIHMQCVLMMNFINEKIYVFLYFWFIAVSFLNVVSWLRYMIFVFSTNYRIHIADSILPTQDVLYASAVSQIGAVNNPLQSHDKLDYFITHILRSDGVLLLIFVNHYAGGLVTHDLSHHLWKLTVQKSLKGNLADEKHDIESGKKDTRNNSWLFTKPLDSIERMPLLGKQDRPYTPSWMVDPQFHPKPRCRSLSAGNFYIPPSAPPYSSPNGSQNSTLPHERALNVNNRARLVDNRNIH